MTFSSPPLILQDPWVLLYPHATGIIVQTSKAAHFYNNTIKNNNIKVIGNPIREINNMDNIVRENVIVSVGRLITSKNFDKNVISASAGVQLRNGKQLEVGLDTEQRILVGVKAPIFKIK